jgi:hypothetical protein
MSSKFNFDGKK